MKEKELMIGVPTKDHPQYICYYLAKTLRCAKKYNIDIYILDSSTNKLTQDIVEERRKQGFSNLFYKKYKPETVIEDKLKDIYVGSGYRYVWLCGDGVIPDIEKDIEIIKEEVSRNRDFICFGKETEFVKKYQEYTEPVKLCRECYAPITYYGATVIKGDLIDLELYTYCKEKYLEQVNPGLFFELFVLRPMSAVYIVHDFYQANPYKKSSVWMKQGRALYAFAELMTRNIMSLPDDYRDIKPEILDAIDRYTKLFSYNHLWILRCNGNLNVINFFRYRTYLKKCMEGKSFVAFLVAFCPRKIADLFVTLQGYC